MISHLGKMLSLVVGGTWAARRNAEQVFGLAVIGDGGTSTGEFHESLNIASVHKVPVLFLIENNHYAFSTPTSVQYNCRHLSDRAIAYGISGRTIGGTDPWTVYSTVCEALDAMEELSLPVLVECDTLRLCGHAAYDKALYVPAESDGPLAEGRSAPPHAASPGGGLRPERTVDCRHRRGRRNGNPRGPRPSPGRWPSAPRQWPVHAGMEDAQVSSQKSEVRGSDLRPPASDLRPPASDLRPPASGLRPGLSRRKESRTATPSTWPSTICWRTSPGLPGRHGRGGLWLGVQNLQRADRALWARSRHRHAAG